MYHLKTKLSPVSKIIRNSLSNDAVLRNYSFFHTFRITMKMNISSTFRCSFLQDTSCKRFSSDTTEKLISKKSKKLNKLDANPDEKESFEKIANDTNFYGAEDLTFKRGKSLLKEENLELFKEIAQGDNSVFELLRYLQTRLDIATCLYGVKLDLEMDDWLEFLNSTHSKRKSFVTYLLINALRDIKKNRENPPALFDLPANEEEYYFASHYDDVQCYHLFHNSMFMKIRDGTLKKKLYFKGFAAMLYSSNMIIDCSYQEYMTNLEIKELAKQMVSIADLNIKSESPFNMIFCNFNQNDKLAYYINKLNPALCTDEYPVTLTKESYLNICSKDDLVYLTPHCKTSLQGFDPKKTYIIGGFVDKSNKKPISLAKAKEQNIAMAKLPLDEFLDWGLGNKCLSLPHVTKIMLDLKCYNNNWMKALEVIPKRCLCKTKIKLPPKSSVATDVVNIFDTFSM